MNKSGFFQNIKLAVFIGYLLLFILTVFGGYELFRQIVKFSNKNNNIAESKQLTLISNALVSLYETESARKTMLSDEFNAHLIDSSYYAQNLKVRAYLDSLYRSSNDTLLHLSLDTVSILLTSKESNMTNMLLLTDSIRKLPYSKKILTTVLSKNDISNLNDIFQKRFIKLISDSSFYERRKKKGFFAKLKDVFVDSQDSTKVISKQNIVKSDSTYKEPLDLLTDTVVQYVNDVTYKSDKKKALFLAKLSLRQEEMLYYDEMLTGQIRLILQNLENKERKAAVNLLAEREKTIKKSSDLVSAISFLALFTLIIFMLLSLSQINKSQEYKNQLEKSKQLAESLSNSRERLLLMISHDIKAPLSSIIGHIELLSKEKMPESEKAYINNMRNSSEHILELVNKLMDYHRLEQGKSEINLMQFSPHHLMEDIFEGFVPAAKEKQLKYTLQNSINSDLTFENDPYIIRQIVNNLISNAIKFTDKGSVKLSSLINNDGMLQISVKDSGKGIKQQDKEKIFVAFERLGNSQQQRSTDGFGLGMAITYKLIQLLEGTINLESEYGKGSEFTILLPLTSANANNLQINQQYEKNTAIGKINFEVLFVDDDVTMLNVYEKLLTREGAKVTVCSDSKQVLALLIKNKYDVLLTDIQMPNMNGFELIREIRKSSKPEIKNLPVIALSARTDISEEKFKSEGFTAFLSKPIPMNTLLNRIYEIINHQSNSTVNSTQNTIGIRSMIEFVEDDKETALDILNVFKSENNIKIKELINSLKTNKWEQIKATSHKLLPLMKMIGAENIVEICEKLENGEKNSEKVKELISLVQNTNQEITDFIKDNYTE